MSSFLLEKESSKTFEEKIGKFSENMKSSIYAAKKSFDKFCIEKYDGRKSDEIFKEMNSLKGKNQTKAIQETLQNWIDWNYQNDNLTSSIRQYISKIKRVFSHNGLRVNTSDFEKELEYTKAIQEELHALTIEEIQSILKYANPKKIGFYLALSCTGARPGELLQVRKKDVDTTKKRIKIRIEAENTKTKTGRSVWLTKEAGSYLITKLRNLKDNDLVWGTHENSILAAKNESTQFSTLCDKAGYGEKYKSNNIRKITLYSFRSYFFGKASDVHREGYAHKMTGHGGYLPQYDRMSDEKKLEMFLKLEPELIIDSTKRHELQIAKQQEEITELQEKNQRIENLMKAQKETTARLDEMSNILGTQLHSQRDENKELSKKDLELFAKIMRLKMNNDSEYSKEMKEFLKKRPGLPEELMKKIDEI